MNGRVDYLITEEEINPFRGPSGLGFNIIGGTDQQYVSIYVSSIKENGAEAQDPEGDKILSVNGKDLKNLLHQDEVNLFRNAGYTVSLSAAQVTGAEWAYRPSRGREPSGVPLAMVLLPVFAFTVAAAWASVRYSRQQL